MSSLRESGPMGTNSVSGWAIGPSSEKSSLRTHSVWPVTTRSRFEDAASSLHTSPRAERTAGDWE